MKQNNGLKSNPRIFQSCQSSEISPILFALIKKEKRVFRRHQC